MRGDEAFRRRHLGEIADPPDMGRVAQCDRRQAHRLAFLDADRDRLRSHRLAEAELPVDDRDDRRVGDDLDALIAHGLAFLEPAQIDGHADHAVAVVACEIGADEISGDACRLGARRARRRKDFRNEVAKAFVMNGDHGDIRLSGKRRKALAAKRGPHGLIFRRHLRGLGGVRPEESAATAIIAARPLSRPQEM